MLGDKDAGVFPLAPLLSLGRVRWDGKARAGGGGGRCEMCWLRRTVAVALAGSPRKTQYTFSNVSRFQYPLLADVGEKSEE